MAADGDGQDPMGSRPCRRTRRESSVVLKEGLVSDGGSGILRVVPFVRDGSRHVLRQETGRASCLFVPTFAVGVGLTLVGGKNVLQTLDVFQGRIALSPTLSATLLGAGIVMVMVAAVAILGRSQVVIDDATRTVETELRVVVRLRGRRFTFADFDRVEVMRGTGRRSPGHGSSLTFYFAVMRGARAAIALERMSLREATAQAHEVARWIGVPLVPTREP